MEPLIKYGNETDDEIVKRHMRRELQTWILHLETIINEGAQLEKIVRAKTLDTALSEALLANHKENSDLLDEFYKYRNVMDNVRECDELECDLFYMGQHDQVFEKYMDRISKFRTMRMAVYQKLQG